MSNKIIVLKTGGKGEDAYLVSVHLFDSNEEANDFCVKNTDNPQDEKYWSYCEIIEEGKPYETARYQNFRL